MRIGADSFPKIAALRATASDRMPRVVDMDQAAQLREEEHFRQVERALLYADDAARKLGDIAAALKKDGAAAHLTAALETAASSIRADHKRLMKSVYFRAPGHSQEQLSANDGEERLAS
ncbi:MAG: hypothetical protein ACR2G3_05250 [Solirubrobacterales bacterium]